ncbi:hypothetical protein TUM4644_06850 [Shewanella colwelliana]|uniref:hypothetical protein n=1 Tax=Shewanella colwelliana TaxID=23 RepID=UPI001BC2555B|nr:hypothetical protein [Shewanella colwelliana]GIU19287.1 hypothetical protein TUM4644_06850 [Shewanella colwelliana]
MTEYIEIDVDEDEFRLFNRLLLSYNDFKQAHEIASVLLESEYYNNVPENRTLIHALNLTVIIAYSRPFKTSRGKLALKMLPQEILSEFDSEQMEIHQQILCDRDTMMAHSDADANNVIPQVIELGNRKMLFPMNASPYATPLLREVMEKVAIMAYELQERTFEMRMEIEPRIIDKLPVIWGFGET